MRVRARAAPYGAAREALPSSALLALAALAITMTTDNPLIYLFMLAPIGVLAGAARGVARQAS
jgi:hypothetical protein